MAVCALVISLASAAARRAMQTEQLDRLGIAHEFMDATGVADIAPPELARLERLWCRPLRPAEVACALSHRRAWAHVAGGHGPILILEDDAVLSSDVQVVLDRLVSLDLADCVTLETFTLAKTLGSPQPLGDGRYSISEVFRDSGGAAAYLLWPRGADRLLRGVPGFLPLADAAINITPGIRKFQVEPACAIQAMFLGGLHAVNSEIASTTVSLPERTSIPRGEWLRYRLRRLWVSAYLGRNLLRGLGRSTRRTVPFAGERDPLTARQAPVSDRSGDS